MSHSPTRELIYQILASFSLGMGAWYIGWRWWASLNWEAAWFSLPLLAAETLAWLGSALFFLSIWINRDPEQKPAPATLNDILPEPRDEDRPLVVDVMFPTYNEDPELVRLSVRDAKAITYPHPVDIRIHVLDDGRRPEVAEMARAEGVNYIARSTNEGYKAGNLRNAMERTSGDVIVICDADTRPFPQLLERTLGHFRDPEVAWVQTPQWFYDLDEGAPLPEFLARSLRLGRAGRALGRAVEAVTGPVRLGRDPFGNDPEMFYDIIQRRRNWCNASFCCGAGSLHRREAVMETSLKSWSQSVEDAVAPLLGDVEETSERDALAPIIFAEAMRSVEFTPYKFHVSEDIYTSIVQHSDPNRAWRSVYHPEVLSKMLSPQDLLTWTTQRFKYAGGTLDIFWNDNPLRLKHLGGWQKWMYASTIYSYLAPLWTVAFLLAPLIYLFTGIAPVSAYGDAFYLHLVPFLIANRLAFMVGTWGVDTWRGEQYYLSFFWVNLKAMRDVLMGRPIKFTVTPKTRASGNFLPLAAPHLAFIGLTLIGFAWQGWRVHQGLGDPAAYLVNVFWGMSNILSLSVMVFAAIRLPDASEQPGADALKAAA